MEKGSGGSRVWQTGLFISFFINIITLLATEFIPFALKIVTLENTHLKEEAVFYHRNQLIRSQHIISLLMLTSVLYHKGPIEISGLIAKKVTAQQFSLLLNMWLYEHHHKNSKYF